MVRSFIISPLIEKYCISKSCLSESNNATYNGKITLGEVDVILPVYVALLDSDKKLFEMQYFSIDGEMRNDLITKAYLQTELSKSINIITSKKNPVSSLVVGFMLDKKKAELLN